MTSRYDNLPSEVRVDFGTGDGMKIYTVDDENDQNNTFGLYNKYLKKRFQAYQPKYDNYIYIDENKRLRGISVGVIGFLKKCNIKCINKIDENTKQFIQDKLDKSEAKNQKKLEEERQERLRSEAKTKKKQEKINAKQKQINIRFHTEIEGLKEYKGPITRNEKSRRIEVVKNAFEQKGFNKKIPEKYFTKEQLNARGEERNTITWLKEWLKFALRKHHLKADAKYCNKNDKAPYDLHLYMYSVLESENLL